MHFYQCHFELGLDFLGVDLFQFAQLFAALHLELNAILVDNDVELLVVNFGAKTTIISRNQDHVLFQHLFKSEQEVLFLKMKTLYHHFLPQTTHLVNSGETSIL